MQNQWESPKSVQSYSTKLVWLHLFRPSRSRDTPPQTPRRASLIIIFIGNPDVSIQILAQIKPPIERKRRPVDIRAQ